MVPVLQMQAELYSLVIIWIISLVLIILFNLRKKTAVCGLAVAYIVNLSLNHLAGALVYLSPLYWTMQADWTLKGFREAVYAVVFFAIGNIFLGPLFAGMLHLPKTQSVVVETESKLLQSLPKMYFLFGFFCYYSADFFPVIPSVSALFSGGWIFMVIGVNLGVWLAWLAKDKMKMRKWLIWIIFFPVITVLKDGFLAGGIVFSLIGATFVMRFVFPKFKFVVIIAVLLYFSLSFYQTYMRDRTLLRGIIWAGNSLSLRYEAFKATFSDFEWFDPFDVEQLERIDSRMNQNILVGGAVEMLDKTGDFAKGKTIADAFISIVPRIIWKDKPMQGGSGNIVSYYTGMEFSEGTSVGVGQVMEFYINFGRVGIIVAFLLIGILFKIVDLMAGFYLLKGAIQKFVFWYFPILALAGNVGGSLVEVVSSGASSFILFHFISKLKYRHYVVIVFAVIFLWGSRFLVASLS